LSEEAKIAYLQEKIKESRGNQKGGWTLFILGIVDSVIGFGFEPILGQYGTFMGIAGIPLAGLGLGYGVYSNYQYQKLLQQLKEMAIVNPKCPNCGKEIPQGNFEFCPFCGKTLKP